MDISSDNQAIKPTRKAERLISNVGQVSERIEDMRIDIDQHSNLRLKEVFSGVLLETEEGNQIGVCMRDDTLEINVCPGGKNSDNWWRVNMQNGTIEQMTATNVPNKPFHSDAEIDASSDSPWDFTHAQECTCFVCQTRR